MPIRFHCQRCRQLLGIASRKAGSEVECPKCGWSQIVPNQEAASAAMAMDQFAKNHEAAENASSLMVYDDQPALIEWPPAAPTQRAAQSTPAAAHAGLPAARGEEERRELVPSGMILYPRRTLYVQGLLLLILFAAGFGSGYVIGRGGAEGKGRRDRAAQERVLIEGRLVYDPGTGRRAGDQNAVIVALPAGKPPARKISSQGIRPEDPPAEPQESVRTIRELGGEYARADASGSFSLVVPDRRRYHLLIISSRATRPKGADVDEADLTEMERYFSMPTLLIGRHKYRWTVLEANDDRRIDHDFGRDGQGDAHQ